ncbi:MAG: DUF4956 domain-containing protein [bacterium]|nr:DUF4956 domain-containing protein [bacterium]
MDSMDLIGYIQSSNAVLTAGRVIINMLVTLIMAVFIYWVYKKTYSGVLYSKSFNVTLLLTTMVTAMVMMVIGTNLALSLGMVGALSIIRFRSAIKDPKDIGFIFWGISTGLSAGTGSYVIAVIGSLIIAMILFAMQKTSLENYPYLLVVKGKTINEDKLRNIIANSMEKYSLRMKNNNIAGTEIIYEIRFVEGMEDVMIKEIQQMETISIVNVISYKGEIAG